MRFGRSLIISYNIYYYDDVYHQCECESKRSERSSAKTLGKTKLISSMNLNLENYHISQTLFARFACTPKVALQRGRPRWKESRTEPYLKLTSSLSSPAHTRSD